VTIIDIAVGPPRSCPRCGRESLLTIDRPHGWNNARGEQVTGTVSAVLCAVCDHQTPGAGPLIAFLTVHEEITDELVDQFAGYVRTWVRALPPLTPDELSQREDEEAWRRGEFDA
jgi:hypothetical protein